MAINGGNYYPRDTPVNPAPLEARPRPTNKHTPRPRIDSQFMRDWLKEDAVLLDMPAEEIIHYLCEEIDQIRIHRDVLLAACLAALEKCPFPVGAASVKDQLQNAIAGAEGETRGEQE